VVHEAAFALGRFAAAKGKKSKRRTRPAIANLNGMAAAFPWGACEMSGARLQTIHLI
jgi:hypothetical protein